MIMQYISVIVSSASIVVGIIFDASKGMMYGALVVVGSIITIVVNRVGVELHPPKGPFELSKLILLFLQIQLGKLLPSLTITSNTLPR